MGHIFIVTTGLTGILNASFEMARRLQLAGHKVTLGAPRPVGDRVAAEGLNFEEFPFINVDPAPPLPNTAGKLRRMWLRFVNQKQRRAAALESYRPYAFKEAVGRLNPDLILIDIELHEYIFAARGIDREFVLLSQWYSTWRRPGLPYLLTDSIPGRGEDGTPAAIDAHWETVKQQRTKMFRKMAARSFGTDRRSVLRELAKENAFPYEYIQENWWPGVFSYSGLPAISMTPFELEFPHDPRPALHYVGPMVHEGRVEQAAVSHGGEDIEELLAETKASGAKLILCTVSTMKAGDTSFLRRLFDAVTERPDWRLFVGLGGKLDPSTLGGIPFNVHTFSYVPQLRVLREADLSINHAGIHTIHECIHFGVPMLVYSGKESDQPGCAARVHHHGLGLMADKDLDDAGTIRRNIERVLTDESFKDKVLAMQLACRGYSDNGTLEKTVSTFLN
ncbi:nucleotide disphospho-sugar-binding domain-containing protein [Neolewinella persica]|uniref:nucleotide disphospho-sugar-binding domain-containing protein n=1 Tax=Neolewinella persica TaxID=70998 RepID=UPI0003721B5F|nr:nucleotide disphospho-sugar-binding domain-containing protein [Neolewinella persica]